MLHLIPLCVSSVEKTSTAAVQSILNCGQAAFRFLGTITRCELNGVDVYLHVCGGIREGICPEEKVGSKSRDGDSMQS